MRRGLVLGAALFVGTLAAPVHAAGSDGMTAEMLFTEGFSLVKKGNYAEACPKFEQSYKLEPAIGALFNWAECETLLGKTASAWLLYRDAAALAVETKKAERAKEARLRVAELEPNLCRLQIDAPPGTRVTRDGAQVDPKAFGIASPVDPGEHVVAAIREDGAKPWSSRVTLEPAKDGTCAARTVGIPESWPGDRADRVVVLPPPPPARSPHRPASGSLGTRRYVSIGIAALGVTALGVGTGFGIAALGKKSDSDAACFADGCTPDGARSLARGQRSADVATGFFLGGVLAIGVATVLWLTAK